MKKILIISPHYPPSNLAAVHRARLFAQHLPVFGWEPIILTVNEKYYEEDLDFNLAKLLPTNQRIDKVNAFRIGRFRLIGDIGLRSFFQLRKKALQLVKTEAIDFVFIPIPSFYVALLGPYLHRKTGVPFGIDYIDPWVHKFPGSEQIFSRHWLSTKLARYLEPIALKNVSLITGVAEGYYKGVQNRNPHLIGTCLFGAMPYGGDVTDHVKLLGLGLQPYLFKKNKKLQFIYAGAMLPKAYKPLEAIFESISVNQEKFSNIEFHFVGTGNSANNENSFVIKPLAEKYNLWQTVIFEYPKRIPYLDVLIHLDTADAVFILGSTEPHYTPSKTYQAVLSKKPILAVLHMGSTAVQILKQSNAGMVFDFNGEEDIERIEKIFANFFTDFQLWKNDYYYSNIKMEIFEQYSAQNVTKILVELLNKVC